MSSQLIKNKDTFFFNLSFDNVGAYISIVDTTGNLINDISSLNTLDSNDLKLINFMQEMKEDTFFSGWENEKRELYIEDNSEILDYIKKSSKLVSENMLPIKWNSEDNKITLKITEANEHLYVARLFLNGNKNFNIVSKNCIFSDNMLYSVDFLDETLSSFSEMETKFEKEELEKYLSLAYKYNSSIEIDFLDYEIIKTGIVDLVPEIIIEKISQDNSLYLKISSSISNMDYDFIKDNFLEYVLLVNENTKKIEISKVGDNVIDEAINDILKKLYKCQKDLNLKSSFYINENFLILQEKIAREFVINVLLQLLHKYKIIGTDNLKKYNIKSVKPKIATLFESGIDFLDTNNFMIDIDGETFKINDVLNAFHKDSYIVLSDGTNAIINKKYINKLERIFKKNDTSSKISFFDLPLLDEIIENKILSDNITTSVSFYRNINQINDMDISIPEINATLREYQVYGYKWLKYLITHNLGACLADDMGLGKTLQAITLISDLCSHKKSKVLIIMPKSLIYNWENEIQKFNPKLKSSIYYSSFRNKESFDNSEIIITTYGTIRNDIGFFKSLNFDLIILDESQNIKNINSQTTKAIMLLNSTYRVALSGTPIENNLSELYSLFRFLNPAMFGTLENFNYNYGFPIQREHNVDVMHELSKKIYPFILRRIKKDVLKDLPEKIEKTLFIGMNNKQKKLYDERRTYYYNLIHNQIKSEGLNKSKLYILQALNELRQITSCPEIKDINVTSSKREVLINNIKDAVENGHKVLVFTNYLQSIKGITSDLERYNIRYLTMSGATKKRQELVDKFQTDDKVKVFVMTLKTGGVGLNLTSADTIFIYDPWWNQTTENQAIDRAYRLGQDRTVFSYKLILKDTIEEKILQLQNNKKILLDNLISDDGASFKQITESDIEFILKD